MDKVIEEKVRRCFGEDVSLKSLRRFLGGAQKHVYLGILDDGFKFVVYVWDKSTSYFSDCENEIDDVFLSSSALMFELNNKLMVEHGIKTPRLYYMDEGFEEPVYALVEYIDGVDLEYEESFLKIRFNDNYKYLKSDNLDENRMKFYHICHCFGNLSGAYELLAKNYYDKDDVLGMISYFRNAIKELCIQNK